MKVYLDNLSNHCICTLYKAYDKEGNLEMIVVVVVVVVAVAKMIVE